MARNEESIAWATPCCVSFLFHRFAEERAISMTAWLDPSGILASWCRRETTSLPQATSRMGEAETKNAYNSSFHCNLSNRAKSRMCNYRQKCLEEQFCESEGQASPEWFKSSPLIVWNIFIFILVDGHCGKYVRIPGARRNQRVMSTRRFSRPSLLSLEKTKAQKRTSRRKESMMRSCRCLRMPWGLHATISDSKVVREW